MASVNRMYYAIVSTGDAIASGAGIVLWAINDGASGGETINVKNAAQSATILSHTFPASNQMVTFPFGIQCPSGAVVTDQGDVVTVMYTLI